MADLRNADLRNADLKYAKLRNTNLSNIKRTITEKILDASMDGLSRYDDRPRTRNT